jgi:lipopolysaccharide/colanic/teichoic acid biosynthesis glycosyltransferase
MVLNTPQSYAPFKRLIDVVGSIVGLIIFSPIMIWVAVWVAIDSKGPILYKQVRITRGGHPFLALKFRTMTEATGTGANDGITSVAKQARITKSGHVLRKYRLDELPQLWNVLVGEMSLVGPRPQTPKYVDIYSETYARINTIRPGITGLASIKYHEKEEAMIAAAGANAERVYIEKILPMKFRYNLFYVRHSSFGLDIKIIWWTVKGMLKKAKRKINH